MAIPWIDYTANKNRTKPTHVEKILRRNTFVQADNRSVIKMAIGQRQRKVFAVKTVSRRKGAYPHFINATLNRHPLRGEQ